ncbi:MAG TPA: ABC transporter substrate-binding protein [Longilinea sp.]|nr:ABC transporter substrate-binding protein [Longilinea sp.]
MKVRFFSLAVILLVLSACQPVQPLTQVTLQLNRAHNSGYGGFYAADQEGLYARQGLAVSFLTGSADVDPILPVVNGEAQFGIAPAEAVIAARSQGLPVKAVVVLHQHSPVVFFSLNEYGIDHPEDLTGQTIRVSSSTVSMLHAVLSHMGFEPDSYSELVLPASVDAFLHGGAVVWTAYSTDLSVELEFLGYDLNYIYPDDYGVHFYGDVIFTTEEIIENQPDLVEGFVRASLAGYRRALQDLETVGSYTIEYDPELDLDLQLLILQSSLPLINTGTVPVGSMQAEHWQAMIDILRDDGVVETSLQAEDVFDNQFIEALTAEGQP